MKKWGIAILSAGAFISYNVGAGFASGNELLQFFGLWEPKGIFLSILGGFLMLVWVCTTFFMIGQLSPAQISSQNYTWAAGNIKGKLFRCVTDICVVGNFILMYAGAGNVLQQQFGLPRIAGGFILAVTTLIVRLKGMKKLEDILGYTGMVILCYIGIFLIITFVGGKSDYNNISLIPKAVAEGKALRVNLFGNVPFSYIPGLKNKNFPVLNGILYSSQIAIAGFPFITFLGKRAQNKKEALLNGVFAGSAFYICVSFMVLMLIFNFDCIVNPKTGAMYAFPALAVINKLWHLVGWTYSLLVFTGLFSATSGYLWVLNDQLFAGQKNTKNSKIFFIAMTIAGLILGNKISFSGLINIMFPLEGVVGVLLTVVCTKKVVYYLIH